MKNSTSQKIIVEYPTQRAWNATINYIEHKIAAGHKLPWFTGPTPALKTPLGDLPAGIGLYDSDRRLVLHCNEPASATVLARWINTEFAEE
ncbi:MAG: hypothetical protein P4L61_03085 [Candidatus Pacebacteria bacterium]|nr:hypothetical protein [Candidatus Paceibacterota bacterium]